LLGISCSTPPSFMGFLYNCKKTHHTNTKSNGKKLIAQYNSLNVNLRWLGVHVQSQANSLNLLLHFWDRSHSLRQQMVPTRLLYCYLHLVTPRQRWTKCIAGQWRTNPWPAVPDWILMPKCRCQTQGADYQKKCRCRTNFSPAFRHLSKWTKMLMPEPVSGIILSVQGVSLSTTCSLDVHWVSLSQETSSVDVQGTFLNGKMSNCPTSNQSDRNKKKMLMRKPVRYRNKRAPVRYRNAHLTDWDTDAGMPMPVASSLMPPASAFRHLAEATVSSDS